MYCIPIVKRRLVECLLFFCNNPSEPEWVCGIHVQNAGIEVNGGYHPQKNGNPTLTNHLLSISTDQEYSYRTALNELKKHGYVKTRIEKDENNRFKNWIWEIDNSRNLDFSHLGNTQIGETTTYNKKDINKKEINKEYSMFESSFELIWIKYTFAQSCIDKNSTRALCGIKKEGFNAYITTWKRQSPKIELPEFQHSVLSTFLNWKFNYTYPENLALWHFQNKGKNPLLPLNNNY